VVFLRNNLDTATFVTNYFPLIIFYVGAKWWKHIPLLRASEIKGGYIGEIEYARRASSAVDER